MLVRPAKLLIWFIIPLVEVSVLNPRLFVIGLLALWPTFADAEDKTVGSWEITDIVDPISDERIRIFALAVTHEPFFAAVQIRCERGLPVLGFGVQDTKFAENDDIKAAMRIDGASPTVGEFWGTDTNWAFTRLTRPTYLKLSHAGKLGLKLSRGGSEWLASFEFSKTDEALRPILEACPIESGSDAAPDPYDPTQPLTSTPAK